MRLSEPEDEDDVDHDDGGFLVKYFWQLYEGPLPAKTLKLLASASMGNGGVDKTCGIFASVAGIISSTECFVFSLLTFLCSKGDESWQQGGSEVRIGSRATILFQSKDPFQGKDLIQTRAWLRSGREEGWVAATPPHSPLLCPFSEVRKAAPVVGGNSSVLRHQQQQLIQAESRCLRTADAYHSPLTRASLPPSPLTRDVQRSLGSLRKPNQTKLQVLRGVRSVRTKKITTIKIHCWDPTTGSNLFQDRQYTEAGNNLHQANLTRQKVQRPPSRNVSNQMEREANKGPSFKKGTMHK